MFVQAAKKDIEMRFKKRKVGTTWHNLTLLGTLFCGTIKREKEVTDRE